MTNKTPSLEKRFLALAFIGILSFLVIYAVFKFVGVFVGALIFFTLFTPLFDRLTNIYNWKKGLAATLVLFLSLLLIVVPFLFIGSLAIDKIIIFNKNADVYASDFDSMVSQLSASLPGLNLEENLKDLLSALGNYLAQLIKPLVENVTNIMINIFLMFFLLYFMLTEKERWQKALYNYLPFKESNSKKLADEFTKVTNTTIVSSGIIAVIQGAILGISFWIVGIPSAFVWGLVGILISFLPMVGTILIWLPASVFLMMSGKMAAGVGLFVFSALITTNIDNILRPIINRRVGDVHPLTSILGIFMGLTVFGLSGIILGPLLISYFFLSIKMYREEYLN